MKANIYDYSRESLEKYLEERGSKKFRATQILSLIHICIVVHIGTEKCIME